MTTEAYVIGFHDPKRVSFSDVESTLRKEGIALTSRMEHMLEDSIFPASDLFYPNGDLKDRFFTFHRNDPDILDFSNYRKEIQRHRMIIYTNESSTIGYRLGYSVNHEENMGVHLERMIEIYLERFKPPYVGATNFASVPEVKEAFEKAGLEVRVVAQIPKVVEVQRYDTQIQHPVYHTPIQQSEENPIFNGVKAKTIRRQEGLTQTGLVRLLGFKDNKYVFISNAETGRGAPHLKSEFDKKYLNWLKDKGYNPYKI